MSRRKISPIEENKPEMPYLILIIELGYNKRKNVKFFK